MCIKKLSILILAAVLLATAACAKNASAPPEDDTSSATLAGTTADTSAVLTETPAGSTTVGTDGSAAQTTAEVSASKASSATTALHTKAATSAVSTAARTTQNHSAVFNTVPPTSAAPTAAGTTLPIEKRVKVEYGSKAYYSADKKDSCQIKGYTIEEKDGRPVLTLKVTVLRRSDAKSAYIPVSFECLSEDGTQITSVNDSGEQVVYKGLLTFSGQPGSEGAGIISAPQDTAKIVIL